MESEKRTSMVYFINFHGTDDPGSGVWHIIGELTDDQIVVFRGLLDKEFGREGGIVLISAYDFFDQRDRMNDDICPDTYLRLVAREKNHQNSTAHENGLCNNGQTRALPAPHTLDTCCPNCCPNGGSIVEISDFLRSRINNPSNRGFITRVWTIYSCGQLLNPHLLRCFICFCRASWSRYWSKETPRLPELDSSGVSSIRFTLFTEKFTKLLREKILSSEQKEVLGRCIDIVNSVRKADGCEDKNIKNIFVPKDTSSIPAEQPLLIAKNASPEKKGQGGDEVENKGKYEGAVKTLIEQRADEVAAGRAKKLYTADEIVSLLKNSPEFNGIAGDTIKKGVMRTSTWERRKEILADSQKEAGLGSVFDSQNKNDKRRGGKSMTIHQEVQ